MAKALKDRSIGSLRRMKTRAGRKWRRRKAWARISREFADRDERAEEDAGEVLDRVLEEIEHRRRRGAKNQDTGY